MLAYIAAPWILWVWIIIDDGYLELIGLGAFQPTKTAWPKRPLHDRSICGPRRKKWLIRHIECRSEYIFIFIYIYIYI